ncbi:MAG TPA: FAD-dependent oxidoreductase [Candidatus Paceibacterota bacterium]
MEQEPKPYTLTLTQKKIIAYQTMEFRFEKPHDFIYRAGQSMRFTVPALGEERTFSIITAPHELDLAFAMRVRGSAFKKYVRQLKRGETIVASGPFGTFGLQEDATKPALYIAGGIGITIFISMLSHLRYTRQNHPITVLYSNRNEEDISYADYLKEIEQTSPHVRVVYTLTNEKPKVWSGELSRINENLIKKYAPLYTETLFLIAATPAMVESMEILLHNIGVLDENIKTKRFRGY